MGFRPGDKIVEFNGKPISRQAELKHELGPRYANEKVRLVALRGDQRLDREVELVDKIEPYQAPFLGILPMRDERKHQPGVVVRYVYPDSPAAAVNLKSGDQIRSIDGAAIEKLSAIVEKLQTLEPGDRVRLEIRRGSETLLVEPTLAQLPEGLPGVLPAAFAVPEAPVAAEGPKTGIVTIKLPEFQNECLAYVPENYTPNRTYGVVVWLNAPGDFKQEELIERWKPLCDEQGFILLAPKSADRTRWQPTEARFVRRMLDDVIKNYHTDAARVAVHGHEGGAAMAYLVGLTNRDLVRAVAAVDAALPRVSQLPETDPVERVAFYTTLATGAENTAAVEAGIKRLREMKFPVTVQNIGDQGRYLTTEELQQLVRWFDSLDRL